MTADGDSISSSCFSTNSRRLVPFSVAVHAEYQRDPTCIWRLTKAASPLKGGRMDIQCRSLYICVELLKLVHQRIRVVIAIVEQLRLVRQLAPCIRLPKRLSQKNLATPLASVPWQRYEPSADPE